MQIKLPCHSKRLRWKSAPPAIFFWSNDSAWGIYSQKLGDGKCEARLEVVGGRQELATLRLRPGLAAGAASATARAADEAVACTAQSDGEWVSVAFPDGVAAAAGEALTVALTA